jgi:hypothetical protein
MPTWLKQATYLASVICGVVAATQPQYAVFLIPAATFLAGYATTHPSDAVATAPKASTAAVANLQAQIQAQLQAQLDKLKAQPKS